MRKRFSYLNVLAHALGSVLENCSPRVFPWFAKLTLEKLNRLENPFSDGLLFWLSTLLISIRPIHR